MFTEICDEDRRNGVSPWSMAQNSRRTRQTNCRVLSSSKKMRGNHDQLIRYRTLHECFCIKGRYWKMTELRAACGERLRRALSDPDRNDPSERTLRDDLQRMRSGRLGKDAPIKYCRSERGYHYSDPNFRLDADELNAGDLRHMRDALALLDQLQSRASILNLSNTLFQLRRRIEDPTVNLREVIQFETTDIQWGQQHLSELYQVVRQREVIELDYHPFNKPQERVVFSPVLLKSYNRRWFLIGWNHDLKRMEPRALDRLKHFKQLPNRYVNPPARFYETWFTNMIGVTRHDNTQIETILVRVDQRLVPYWESKCIHPSQKLRPELEDETGNKVFELNLYPNYELEMRLLGFGEEVEVLEPLSLRKKLKERIHRMFNRYGSKPAKRSAALG